jgi:superfamily I DNA and/or RNA helicase
MSSRPPLECWHALTGAAGTGKTRVTANLVLQYLHATAKRSFPPRRVLVISASHFAIDNFLRVYREEGGQKYVPCRFITKHVRARLEGAEKLGDKVIDKDIYDWSHEHYKRIAADLPQYRTVQESHDWLGAYHSRLNSQLLELRAKRDDENGKKRFAFFPSHERWRSKHAPEKSWNHVREVSTGLKYFQDKLDQLLHIVKGNGDTFVEKGAHSNEEIEDPIELYKLFAAEVVATTVDAFDRLPDMRFDLVIFEEASQFAVIKFLKALTKIMRTRDEQGGDSPWIILSGDPQQLPPFFNGALCPSVPQ